MRIVTIFAAACVASTTAIEMATMDLETKFLFWAQSHGKSYSNVEEFTARLANWTKTHFEIEEYNNLTDSTVVLGHNSFSDLTDEEYEDMLTLRPEKDINQEPTLLDASDLPNYVNWVEAGAVNPVQDQRSCGACWAFSAICSIEGHHFIQSGKLLKLSEQQCVDCDPYSIGCSGGWLQLCLKYVQDNGGTSLEEDYPYRARQDACVADRGGPVQVSSVNRVESKSESQLMAAIAQGPTSVAVQAGCAEFRNYSSGVLTSEDCYYGQTNHAVAAVGYGTTDDGIDYYLVRNSWASRWGDAGYIKIGRNGDGYGICGIQEVPYWATTN